MKKREMLLLTSFLIVSIVLSKNLNIPVNYPLTITQSNTRPVLPSPFVSNYSIEYLIGYNRDYDDSSLVIEIDILGSNIWLATAIGVSHSNDLSETWFHYDTSSGIGKGGGSGVSISLDNVWLATIYDTLISDYSIPAGGGISHTFDNGANWLHFQQPMDDFDDTIIVYFDQSIPALPITTNIQNTTYDITHIDSLVFIASWAGGLRKTIDNGNTWQRILLPSDDMNFLDSSNANEVGMLNPQDPPYGNHNHKGFSVIAYEQNNNIIVWCGTAAGINKSEDGGLTWVKYNSENDGITGNWVVAIHHQTKTDGDVIWAATLKATDPQEENGVSFTIDDGNTWQTILVGKRPYNISSFGDTTFISTSEGLYRTTDGINWEWFEETVWLNVYDTQKDTIGRLWIGTSDNLIVIDDSTGLWHEINFGSAPYILSVSAPDTMMLPDVGFYFIDTVYAEVNDPDSVEDVSQVWFLSLMPNGEYANNGNPIYLQNNGNGMFSYPLILSSDAQLGTYEWTFTAQDLSGNLSEPVIHYIEIIDTTLSSTEEFFSSPFHFSLFQNYPNPFNFVTTISYQLPQLEFVNISIYDISGKLIDTVIDEQVRPGFHTVKWNSKGFSSGVYFYKIVAGKYSKTGKCILLK